MNNEEKLKRMWAKKAENRAKGIKPPNPMEKSRQNPKSRVLAIAAFCYDYMGREPGWRNAVKECTSPNCSLFGFRPYK